MYTIIFWGIDFGALSVAAAMTHTDLAYLVPTVFRSLHIIMSIFLVGYLIVLYTIPIVYSYSANYGQFFVTFHFVVPRSFLQLFSTFFSPIKSFKHGYSFTALILHSALFTQDFSFV